MNSRERLEVLGELVDEARANLNEELDAPKSIDTENATDLGIASQLLQREEYASDLKSALIEALEVYCETLESVCPL